MNELVTSETQFLTRFAQSATKLMWLLGAGVSRTAGMPTASDIIWDLKLKAYCRAENQDISKHDVSSEAIQRKLQNYFDSKGAPALWSSEEYSHYFDLSFGGDYKAQQQYVAAQVAPDKIALNIGHRVFAALMKMGLIRIVFTTNFDAVFENAYSAVAGENLDAFSLDGSYAALDAFNNEKFPLYAKMHGDFKYQKLKNLTADLLSNDEQIQKCLLAASSQYGLIVSGYSGRDANVMTLLTQALSTPNAFPHGIYWAATRAKDVADKVKVFILAARAKGIEAGIIEVGTFDIMLSKIWKQVPQKPAALDAKVLTAKARQVSIALPAPGSSYPVLRTNALPVISCPMRSGAVECEPRLTFQQVIEKRDQQKSTAVITKLDTILFWGGEDEIKRVLGRDAVKSVTERLYSDPIKDISESKVLKAFYEEALARALCEGKPLQFQQRYSSTYLIVPRDRENDALFQPIREAVGYRGQSGPITGVVRQISNATWHEAISVRLEERNKALWLLLNPETWVMPASERENAKEFVRTRTVKRYNPAQNQLLDAWIKVLFGNVGAGAEVTVSSFEATAYPAVFKINTRTAFSRGA